NRLAVSISQSHGKATAVTFLSLHLQSVVIGVGVAIQVADRAEQTRLTSLALADVRLPGTATVDVGVGRWIRLIEVGYGVVDMAGLAAHIANREEYPGRQRPLNIEAPLHDTAGLVVRRKQQHVGSRRGRTLAGKRVVQRKD